MNKQCANCHSLIWEKEKFYKPVCKRGDNLNYDGHCAAQDQVYWSPELIILVEKGYTNYLRKAKLDELESR